MTFSEKDQIYLKSKKLSQKEVETQLEQLHQGTQMLHIKRPATVDDGIVRLSGEEQFYYVNLFDRVANGMEILRFTPASGAASRMFKHLMDPENPKNKALVDEFISRIGDFAFSDLIIKSSDKQRVISQVLSEEGLNYEQLPKALIHFHRYDDHIRTAFEEQFVEASNYALQQAQLNFHFTISEDHQPEYDRTWSSIKPLLEKMLGCNITVNYSYQHSSTDTVSISTDGKLVRQESGEILLRPGGHGALISNLNQLEADIVFMKNIDNVAREEYHEEGMQYKKVLAGYLIEYREQVYEILSWCETGFMTDKQKEIVRDFTLKHLGVDLKNASVDKINKLYDRPIRVCGMVRNEGKAGGGPFWVDYKGMESLQIVEAAQFDDSQKELLEKSTHFNPVDIICSVRDHHGKKYNLHDYIDQSAYFIADKSYQGQEIKVLERPGLWNGGMAHWNTIFIEVPVETFFPVKTVNDLLQVAHSGI